MTICIHSKNRDVPRKNPFKNDLLERKTPVETLTRLIDAVDGPRVMAVDAAWGMGKTTFLNLWAWHLRESGFPVICFNAWETDFSKDPFISFSSELIKNLSEEYNVSKFKIKKIRKISEELLLHIASGIIRYKTLGIVDLSAWKKKTRLSAHLEAKKLVQDFKEALQGTARALSKKKERPLIVMVDELDRCRPSYAVEFLEVTKHLFSVNHIVFVLAINRPQLAHSVKAIYGSSFDAHGYLGRFFDVDFQLPQPSRKAFINHALEWAGHEQAETHGDLIPIAMLQSFFSDSGLSFRQVEQAVNRLRWVVTSLPRTIQRKYFSAATAALILRTIDPDLYGRFVRDEATTSEIEEEMFERPGLKALKGATAGSNERTIATLFLANLDDEKSRSAVRWIEMFSEDLLDAQTE